MFFSKTLQEAFPDRTHEDFSEQPEQRAAFEKYRAKIAADSHIVQQFRRLQSQLEDARGDFKTVGDLVEIAVGTDIPCSLLQNARSSQVGIASLGALAAQFGGIFLLQHFGPQTKKLAEQDLIKLQTEFDSFCKTHRKILIEKKLVD